MYWPMSAYASAGRLYVADFNNNRVLVWSSIPTTNVAATAVLGQPDMTTGTANTGGLSSQTLCSPYTTFSDGVRLYVADGCNDRVVIFPTP